MTQARRVHASAHGALAAPTARICRPGRKVYGCFEPQLYYPRRLHATPLLPAPEGPVPYVPTVAQPQGVPPVFEDHLELMFDLQLLAFQSDLTRVISFMISKEQSARPYPQIGVPDAHHPLSHHGDSPELIERMSKINRYHTELLAKYVERLHKTQDGDGSLLDHTTILYGSGISNSNAHSGDNLPLMLIGGGAGRLDGGQHIVYKDEPSMANLLVTLMDKLEVPVDKIGGSTGHLPIDTLGGM